MRIARNVIAGAISGLGVVILLQQYAVAYPTGMITILGILVGIAVQFGVDQLASRRTVAIAGMGAGAGDGGATFEPTAGGTTIDAADAVRWSPTHRAPASGLDAWDTRDSTVPPAAHLDPGLDVAVEETLGDWAHITCENGWKAWVDARRLEAKS